MRQLKKATAAIAAALALPPFHRRAMHEYPLRGYLGIHPPSFSHTTNRTPSFRPTTVGSTMEFDVTIEILRDRKFKYEIDHETGRIRLDRMFFTSTRYPDDYNY